MADFVKKTGWVAPVGLELCALRAVYLYPECYVGAGNRSRVTECSFEPSELFDRQWNFFYLHCGEKLKNKVLYFVPTAQFEELLHETNQKLGTRLTIPHGAAAKLYKMSFPNNGTPRPRYLGESNDKAMADQIKTAIPPHYFKPDKGEYPNVIPNDRSTGAFIAKVEALLKLDKNKKANEKAKKLKDRTMLHRSWGDELKRTQRYLGLGEIRSGHHQVLRQPDGALLELVEYDDALASANANPEDYGDLDVNQPARFSMEEDIVFVCVDIEAYEHSHEKITEIGIATLDTRDIVGVAPGEGGKQWFTKIRSRHFRIQEHAYLVNSDYVHGCPDRFDFGQSEFVHEWDAPKMVADCFKAPFSGPAEQYPENSSKRKVVFVGHDANSDIRMLKVMGYNVLNLPPHEIMDTVNMYRALRREHDPKNLAGVLAYLDIAGWNLHNAGNDATFTLQAMLAIAIKEIKEREIRSRGEEEDQRIAELMERTRLDAVTEQEAWNTADVGDGGSRVEPPADLPPTRIPSDPALNTGAKGRRAIARASAMPNASFEPTPNIEELKALTARACKIDDLKLIDELVQQALNDKALYNLMSFTDRGEETHAQSEILQCKIQNARGLLEWETMTESDEAPVVHAAPDFGVRALDELGNRW